MSQASKFLRYQYLLDVVQAHQLAAEMSHEEASAKLAKYEEMRDWLGAENRWRISVQGWLDAETKWTFAQQRLDEPTYAAARRGWELIKQYVPNQDGVDNFVELPDSMQFRYAAFAAAVLGLLPPPEVRSQKQELADTNRAQLGLTVDE